MIAANEASAVVIVQLLWCQASNRPGSRHLQLATRDVHDKVGITQTNYYLLPVIGNAQTDFKARVR